MQNQHIKNRARKLEKAYSQTTEDAKRLYSIAVHWRATAMQQHIETKLLAGVAFLAMGFMSACLICYIILREASK